MGSAAARYADYSGGLGGAEPTPLSQHPAFIAWKAVVARRRNAIAVFPSGPNKGKLAERYKDAQGVFRYALPPMDVRAAEQAILRHEAAAIQRAKNIAIVQAPVKKVIVPAARIVWEGIQTVDEAGDRIVARADQAIQQTMADTGRTVAGLPRKAISELLGVPEWLIPIAAIGTGLILLSGLYDRVRE